MAGRPAGLFGAPELTVVVGEYAHSTVVRALGLLGLGRDRVRRVPADDQGRMRADCLPGDVTGPVVICAQAGEVNTGAFDPFPSILESARRHQAWMHVDGAFGLWALTDPSRAHLTAALADADSWATDGHKWLNVPYDCGIALVRRPEDLRRSFTATAGYLPPDTGFEAANLTPQSSQRARQVEVWAVLRTLGRQGVTDLITRTCRHAQTMAVCLGQAGLEGLNDVVFNQVLVRAATDEQTRALITAVQGDGGRAGAGRPCGSTARPCGSASPAGPRPPRTSGTAQTPSSPLLSSRPPETDQTRPVICRYVTMLRWTHTRQRGGRVVRRG